jgi:hypothetical protein
LSGRGLCDGLIARDLETSRIMRLKLASGVVKASKRKKKED